MQDDDKKHQDQFNAALPLPVGDSQKKKDQPSEPTKEQSANPAADLIRKKIEEAYAAEPDAKSEIKEIEAESAEGQQLSKHQKFIMELTSSGKPLHEVQMAWHEYYAALPDGEKHAVWNEFYKAQNEASHYHEFAELKKIKKTPSKRLGKKPRLPAQLTKPASANVSRQLKDLKQTFTPVDLSGDVRIKQQSPLHSILFGLGVGFIVLVIFLFSFFNERFIAPFIQPSRTASNIPIINTDTPVSASPELIIPKINVQIPIVYAADNNDNTIETDLESGVVHYADTAMPGQKGNLVVFGHSSNNIFNPGKYKFAFVLLHELTSGDTFYIDNDGKRYTYEVYQRQIVDPSDVSVLGLTTKLATATLITCDPPGTSINRLVVTAEQINPDPSANTAATTDNQKAISQTKILPSNSPSLWSRFIKWFWN